VPTVAEMLAAVAPRPAGVRPAPGGSRAERFETKRLHGQTKRRLRRYIIPANASILIEHLPAPGEEVHWLLPGDFVFGELLPRLAAARGPFPRLTVSTLGMSAANLSAMVKLLDTGAAGRIVLLASSYWRATDRQAVPAKLDAAALADSRLTVNYSRIHAKLVLAANDRGDAYVFAGSANLRSSGTIEQLTAWNDPELLAWHQAWMDGLAGGTDPLTGGHA